MTTASILDPVRQAAQALRDLAAVRWVVVAFALDRDHPLANSDH
jgi:hypothetical protein